LISDSKNNYDANLCYNEDFIQKLAYLVVVPAMKQKIKEFFHQQLACFAETVLVYFKDTYVSKFMWRRNPFATSNATSSDERNVNKSNS